MHWLLVTTLHQLQLAKPRWLIFMVYIFAKYEKGHWIRSLSFGFLENVNFSKSMFLKNEICCFKMKWGVKVFLMLSHFNFSLQIITVIHLWVCQKRLIFTPILSLFVRIFFNFVELLPNWLHGGLVCLGNSNCLSNAFLPIWDYCEKGIGIIHYSAMHSLLCGWWDLSSISLWHKSSNAIICAWVNLVKKCQSFSMVA